MVPLCTENKEGGNETKMKRVKGGEEVRLLSGGADIKREEMRERREQLRNGVNSVQ